MSCSAWHFIWGALVHKVWLLQTLFKSSNIWPQPWAKQHKRFQAACYELRFGFNYMCQCVLKSTFSVLNHSFNGLNKARWRVNGPVDHTASCESSLLYIAASLPMLLCIIMFNVGAVRTHAHAEYICWLKIVEGHHLELASLHGFHHRHMMKRCLRHARISALHQHHYICLLHTVYINIITTFVHLGLFFKLFKNYQHFLVSLLH